MDIFLPIVLKFHLPFVPSCVELVQMFDSPTIELLYYYQDTFVIVEIYSKLRDGTYIVNNFSIALTRACKSFGIQT